jgi:hypothetical protein
MPTLARPTKRKRKASIRRPSKKKVAQRKTNADVGDARLLREARAADNGARYSVNDLRRERGLAPL